MKLFQQTLSLLHIKRYIVTLKKLINPSLKQMSSSSIAMKKHLVYVTQPIPREALQIFASDKNIELIVNERVPLHRKTLLDMVRNCDGLFCTLNEKIDVELLNESKQLKVIATSTVGYDHIDLKECAQRNIPVGWLI